MWKIYTTATAFHQRPSDLAGLSAIGDDWACYIFDAAVAYFGNWIEQKLAEKDTQSRPRYSLSRLLEDDKPVPGMGKLPGGGRLFTDPISGRVVKG